MDEVGLLCRSSCCADHVALGVHSGAQLVLTRLVLLQIKQKARGAMGGSSQAASMDNTTTGQGNMGQGFDQNRATWAAALPILVPTPALALVRFPFSALLQLLPGTLVVDRLR